MRGADLRLFDVVEELSGLYPERVIDTAIQPGMSLHCAPERLAQLLSNLLKNALVHGSDGRFTLSVTNGGQDLSPAVIAQLLKPYWRAASRAGSEGLGLGLYIVDQIARGHGGTIEVASSAGSTSITFTMAANAPA